MPSDNDSFSDGYVYRNLFTEFIIFDYVIFVFEKRIFGRKKKFDKNIAC